MKKRVAILISGRGSNMTALIEAAKANDYPAKIALVVSNRPDAAGLHRARADGIPTEVIVGDRDPCKKMYVAPLQKARTDWKVVEIEDAGHIDCVVKPAFRKEVVRWVKANTK